MIESFAAITSFELRCKCLELRADFRPVIERCLQSWCHAGSRRVSTQVARYDDELAITAAFKCCKFHYSLPPEFELVQPGRVARSLLGAAPFLKHIRCDTFELVDLFLSLRIGNELEPVAVRIKKVD